MTENQPPVISSSLQLNVTVNQSTELILDASDPDYDNISYRLITSPYKGIFTYEISGTRFKAEYMPADLDSVSLEYVIVLSLVYFHFIKFLLMFSCQK